MASDLFEDVVNFTLDREGRVVSEDPTDGGGPTAYGISYRAHPEAWKTGPPTLEDALDIYRYVYWSGNGVNLLPPAVAAAVFDYRVHSGNTAIEELQRMIGVEPDGDIGEKTLDAVRAFGEVLVGRELTEKRRDNLRRLTQTMEKFRRWGRGWSMRCDKVISFLNDIDRKRREGEYGDEIPPATTFGRIAPPLPADPEPVRKRSRRKKETDDGED